MKHWTQASNANFAYSISLDFFTQLRDRIDECGISRKEFAAKLDVTPGAVSQILNDPPENPKLESFIKYSRELGLKVAVIAYDDHDPHNDKGPIFSGVFEKAWRAMGSPRDLGAFAIEGVEEKALRLHFEFSVEGNELMADKSALIQAEVPVYPQAKNVSGEKVYAQTASA